MSLYSKSILSSSVILPFSEIGNNIRDRLQELIKQQNEGICVKEGYIRPDSIVLMNYSSGRCENENVIFNVSFSCMVCFPLSGLNIIVTVTNVTKAGIRGKSRDPYSPIDVFIAREYNLTHNDYKNINVNDEITVETIAHRFELNDKKISIIAKLIGKKNNNNLKLIS